MSAINWWFLLPMLIAGVVSAMLVFCRAYDDGLFGRLALAAITVAAAVVIISEIRDGRPYTVDPEVLLFAWGMAVFLGRHLVRVWWFTYFSGCGRRADGPDNGSRGVAR